jgi:hypothetical protein
MRYIEAQRRGRALWVTFDRRADLIIFHPVNPGRASRRHHRPTALRISTRQNALLALSGSRLPLNAFLPPHCPSPSGSSA